MSKKVQLACEAMATRWEFVLMGEDESRLRSAGEEAIEEIRWLERQMNFYDASSDVSRINRMASNGPVRVEPQLFALLQRCVELGRMTEGAFDITVAPLLKLWGFVQKDMKVPAEEDIARTLERVGMDKLLLNEQDFTLSFTVPDMLIDLGSIGKGYALDRAMEILGEYEITSALVHGGTSAIATIGEPLDGAHWRVGLEHPNNQLHPEGELRRLGYVNLPGLAFGVSAVWGKAFQSQDRLYGHVLDPRTGWPTTGAVYAALKGTSNTVIDALATAALVMGESFLALEAGEIEGSLLFCVDGKGLKEVTKNFSYVRE